MDRVLIIINISRPMFKQVRSLQFRHVLRMPRREVECRRFWELRVLRGGKIRNGDRKHSGRAVHLSCVSSWVLLYGKRWLRER